MILEMEHWHFGYDQIQKDCRSDGDGMSKTCLLLCNADVDALSCARILSYMLRSDGIHYQLLPCTNYSALENHLSTVPLDDVRAVVLLNFGAARNLTKLFQQHLHETVKVYVMDCRRPVHLANVYAGANVVVFIGEKTEEHFPSDGDNLSGTDSTTDESDEDSEDDSDDDSDDDSNDNLSKDGAEDEAQFDDIVDATDRTPMVQEDDQASDYDGEDEREPGDDTRTRQRTDMDADDASTSQQKRQRRDSDQDSGATDMEHSEPDSPAAEDTQEKISPREMHRQRRENLRRYYTAGSFYGSPASFIAYQLAVKLRFGEQSDLLWLACVGVTDAYLHARLDLTGYATIAMQMRNYCQKLFPDNMYERAINTVYAEDLTGARNGQDRTKITFNDNGRIIAEKDYRFFLLRHSSLFDSMVQSDYISTKLQVWTKNGLHTLQELLAKMGYPLEECQQPFAFMKPNLRRRLHEKITAHAEEYGLENFQFTSFFRVTGYQSLLSASDTSYAVTALLECDTPAMAMSESGVIDEEKAAVEAFNIAYDALNPNSSPSTALNGLSNEGHDANNLVNGGSLTGNTGIGAGIRLAMSLQRTIIFTAVSLVGRNAITRLRHFRYAYLTCTSAGENQTSRSDLIRNPSNKTEDAKSHIFSKPLALSRLAHYLMDMHRENGKWAGSKARPLVLLAEKPSTGTYLVVGYEYPERAGSFVRNRFGHNFELTAKSTKGTFKIDSFDSNVVEVKSSDVQRFIEQLHYILDSI